MINIVLRRTHCHCGVVVAAICFCLCIRLSSRLCLCDLCRSSPRVSACDRACACKNIYSALEFFSVVKEVFHFLNERLSLPCIG